MLKSRIIAHDRDTPQGRETLVEVGVHRQGVLYPIPCSNEASYKGRGLYYLASELHLLGLEEKPQALVTFLGESFSFQHRIVL